MLKQSLILSALIWALTTISEVCKPWGIRLYFGDSYMFDKADNDLRIVFNTDVVFIEFRTHALNHTSSWKESASNVPIKTLLLYQPITKSILTPAH